MFRSLIPVFGAVVFASAPFPLVGGDPPPAPGAATPDEPLAANVSLERAGEYLDVVTLDWLRERKCASCHTGYPYLMARAALGEPKAPALLEVRKFFEERVASWDRGGKGVGYLKGAGPVRFTEGVTEVVAVAATLAFHDARSTGKLHPFTRQALARTWELQRADGSWAWNKTGLAPQEHDDYFGAVYAAVGVGHAPEGYAGSDEAKEGVARLTAYLRKNPPPDPHHKAWLLWASCKLDGLLEPAEREKAVKELRSLQRADGGWSLASLGAWKRDGKPDDQPGASDGYGTGLVVYVLRQAGVAADDPAVKKGVRWLKANQRESGRWFTRSVNGGRRHYIANAGTAYAVMALRACEPGGG
ncbi:MAG TPA: prenyltransferase/squalene oxidase repeat-containing protein [Gemmataceae bacterium]|nr:prenyltransferase/squalene oxidase repeat-containing protein [Gemmataceae bacterium]